MNLPPLVLRGDPNSAVLREIERLEPDLIVVGSTTETPAKHDADLGSMALRIAMHARGDYPARAVSRSLAWIFGKYLLFDWAGAGILESPA